MRDNAKRIYLENKALVDNVLGSLLIKVGAVLVAFFTTPAYMRFFSEQTVLGVWFTLVAVFNMFIQFDLGIGNGLRNRLSESIAIGNAEQTKKYVSSAYIVIGLFSIIITIVASIIVACLPLNTLLNVSPEIISLQALRRGILICTVALGCQMVLRLVASICYALQRAAVPNFLLLATNTLLLLTAWFAPKNLGIERGFVFFAGAYAVFINFPLIMATVWVFYRELPHCWPRRREVNNAIAKDLLNVGLTFFILQTIGLLLTNCNEILITMLVGPQKTVEYQVYYKIFSLPSSMFFLMLVPFWSAATKAKAQKKFHWLNKTHFFLCIAIVIASVLTIAITPFVPLVAEIWLGKEAESITIIWQYSMCFALWTMSSMWFHGNCTYANGLEWLDIQKRLLLPAGLMHICGSFIAVRITQSWIAIVIVNALILFLFGTLQMISTHRRLKKLEKGMKQ